MCHGDHQDVPDERLTNADPKVLRVELTRGWQLRDRGQGEAAMDVWDRVLAVETGGASEAVKLTIAETLYAKAHLLLELGQASEAEPFASQAGELALTLGLPEAQIVAADATEVRAAALVTLGQLDRALELNEFLAARYASSDCFELRLCLGRELRGAIWIHMRQQSRRGAIKCAEQLTELLKDQTDPARVIQAGELIVSSAETLHAHSTWRRVPAAIIDQSHRMFTAVEEMAASAGGAIGVAVAVNSRLAAANALVRDRHVFASYRDRVDRPSVTESELTALEQVEEAARASGADDRYLQLAFERATVLHEAGRTSDAAALFEELHQRSQAKGGLAGRGGAALVRAARTVLGL